MTRSILVLVFVALASIASAQATPDAVRLRVYLAATPTVAFRDSLNVPLTLATCDLPPLAPATQSIANPTLMRVNDPARPLRECQINMATFFTALPSPGDYRASAVFVAAGVDSPSFASTDSFSRAPVVLPPAAPTVVRVL